MGFMSYSGFAEVLEFYRPVGEYELLDARV